MTKLLKVAAIGAWVLLVASAQANTSQFIVSGEGEALITTGSGTVTITLTDLYVNPGSVADNLSAFIFTLNSSPTTDTIASSSGTSVTVASGGGYTLGSSIATGWTIALSGATTTLDDLVGSGHAGPADTIIGAPGSGGYTSADGSIAGNGPHNPFLYETATFTLDEAGVTAASTVTSTTFQFGTTDGSGRVAGTLVATPEPSTLTLLGCAVFLMVLGKVRRGSPRQ